MLTEKDMDEFIEIARREGVELSPEEAVAAATRVTLLYLRLALPTPSEVSEDRLAKSGPRGTVSKVEHTNQ